MSSVLCCNKQLRRFQLARGLRRGSATARLLVLRGRIPPGHECMSLVSIVCNQVEFSASGWSLVRRSPSECGVSGCDRETSIMWRPWSTRRCYAVEKRKSSFRWLVGSLNVHRTRCIRSNRVRIFKKTLAFDKPQKILATVCSKICWKCVIRRNYWLTLREW